MQNLESKLQTHVPTKMRPLPNTTREPFPPGKALIQAQKKKKKNPNSKNASSEGSVSPQAHAVIIQHVQSPHKTSSLASSPVSYLYLTSQQGAREASEGTTRVCKASVQNGPKYILNNTQSAARGLSALIATALSAGKGTDLSVDCIWLLCWVSQGSSVGNAIKAVEAPLKTPTKREHQNTDWSTMEDMYLSFDGVL